MQKKGIIRTPYVPHYFGETVTQKLSGQRGWLTAGVASSAPWPKSDVWIVYNGDDFFIRGTERNGQPSSPCITVPCNKDEENSSLNKIYRLTSVLSWYMRGYVDVSGYMTSSHPILYGDVRNVFSNLGLVTDIHFNCNHLPIIDDENIRKALAFWREGCRLVHVNDSYSFLSFYKVIESQFVDGRKKREWIEANIHQLEGRALERVKALRNAGINVSSHIFESGRCAVAHAYLQGEIINPDIPEDKRRISADLDLIQGLAQRFILHELNVPDEMSLYKSRDRLEPWINLISPNVVKKLRAGKVPDDGINTLNGVLVSIAIWPEAPMPELDKIPIQILESIDGIIRFCLTNNTKSIYLEFVLDFPNGKAHTQLQNSGLLYNSFNVSRNDVIAFTTYSNSILGNRIVELQVKGCEPIDCEVVIPCNIIQIGLAEELEIALKRHQYILDQSRYRWF